MISAGDARKFAEAHFPEAPEKLADELGISIRESPLDGCDGWCLTLEDRSIIRINSNQTGPRKSFTLAHDPVPKFQISREANQLKVVRQHISGH